MTRTIQVRSQQVLLLIVLLTSSNLLAQWQEVSTVPPGIGQAIDAVGDQIAVVTANNHIYRTDDAGVTWTDISPDSGIFIDDVSLIDSQNIWICTNYPFTVQASSDGGDTWHVQYYGAGKTDYFNYIEMFDSLNGIAMGDALSGQPALILKTNDGGQHWISIDHALIDAWSGDLWRRLDFIDTQTGYFFVSGISPNQLYKTVDSCQTWSTTPHPENRLHVMKFYDEEIGLSVAWSQYSITRDGGATWEILPKAESWGMDIEFHPEDPSLVWYCAGNQLFFSNDTGRTWTNQLNTSNPIDIVITETKKGWVLTRSTVFRTESTVNLDHTKLIPVQLHLDQNYPNPFNPNTTIGYDLPDHSHVNLTIYDVNGREVVMLQGVEQPGGHYDVQWNGTDGLGNQVSTGIYFARLQARAPQPDGVQFSETIKMVLLR
ncbi:MAG: T9SS type A sorting domain-containing protein [Candidatus Marinimicrobia bacterium]|nr:T9SS type A sorting domain-containing protein [Candidatus Neomarinimicrobiota bacterium]MCF7850312.1 T9SS type A sorting domain-containing protein [Candidatus Neomarinimicrobiota bacterium]MCF7903904.1 T9SS type A sorting domain-containing protein [Candidatus Neomarinimicrobiota bacterium]